MNRTLRPDELATVTLPIEQPGGKRCFLFLQGPPTGFWHRLAARLEREGARVVKVNTCLADRLFWRGSATAYRGSLRDWPRWLAAFCSRQGVTDLICYADRQPYHDAAFQVADRLRLNFWTMEFGYLRPDWLTLVEGRMGPGNMPQDDDEVLRLGAHLPEPDWRSRYGHSFVEEAAAEVTFHLSNVLGRFAYPRYRSDRFYWPVHDYLAWLPELVRERRYSRDADQVVTGLTTGKHPFFLVALQLESDHQIRSASPFARQIDMIRAIFASFAAAAPAEARLLIKIHPLDNGLERWFPRIGRLARNYGLSSRVDVIKGGDLDTLLIHAKGVLLANSTVGLHAIRAGVPVLALGEAVFRRNSLCHMGNIDEFWCGSEPPDPTFSSAFLRLLATRQLKGSFYDHAGQKQAIDEAARRLLHVKGR
jgi:capsular polysaccharide export protein